MKKTGKNISSNELNPNNKNGEYPIGPVSGTALIKGITFGLKALQYTEINGKAVFEGDIILGLVSEMQAASDASGGQVPQFACGITGQQARWPNSTIPYDIDPAIPNQLRITDAIAHWEANTGIQFILRTAANQNQYPDYLHFIWDSGSCWSFVGRRGGRQDLGLANWGTTGTAIHEIGHTVGLWHEQSREDRDQFVRIVWANIDPNAQHNFNQHIADGDDLGPYDYGSIMHYNSTAFSINGQATIVTLQPLPAGVVLGQRNGFSQGDINGVNTMYPPIITLKEVRKDPIKDPIKDPRPDTIKEIRKDPFKDPRPDTIKEVRKDPIHDPTVKEVRKDPLSDPTVKEVGKDPINPKWPVQPGDYSSWVSPFVTGAPSRAPQAISDPLTEATKNVQELEEALAMIEQQQAELVAAYNEAVQVFEALSRGQV